MSYELYLGADPEPEQEPPAVDDYESEAEAEPELATEDEEGFVREEPVDELPRELVKPQRKRKPVREDHPPKRSAATRTRATPPEFYSAGDVSAASIPVRAC